MYRGFESFRVTVIAAVLVLCGVGSGKNVTLPELPAAVQATVEREIKGFEIGAIDLEKDDSKVVYGVKAESADGRQSKTVVAEDGSLMKKDEQIRGEDLPALIAESVRKSVGDVVFYRIIRTTSFSGEVEYDIEADTEDSEIVLHIAGDGSITNKDVKPIDRSSIQFKGDLSRARDLLIKLRNQLKIAVFGDSRGKQGVNPRYFSGEENLKYPMVLNFSEDGEGLGRCKAIIEDYLPLAPNLEWVIYATSPRIFNRFYENWGADSVQVGSAYRTDRMGWGVWKKKNTERVPRSDPALKGRGREIGYEVDDRVGTDDFAAEDDREKARERLSRGRYELDAKRINAFESMIGVLEKRNIKLFTFTPPIHPVSAGQPCADDDGTTSEAYDELVAKMRAFEKKYSNFYFVDVNNKGRHNIPGTDFADMDHLNKHGSKTLTLMLNDFIRAFDSGERIAGAKSLAK
ncbi:MAG: hypothetical protein E4H40_00630 [Candidatus Brocadiia bacterium]|nr:MAG: hypothetical protein E4H40_00630 [Candidatus Brocadiia bacterium]